MGDTATAAAVDVRTTAATEKETERETAEEEDTTPEVVRVIVVDKQKPNYIISSPIEKAKPPCITTTLHHT